MRLKVVTGYVPIQDHPRSAKEYGDLGENMFGALQGEFTIHPFYETVQETWLAKLIRALPGEVSHSTADNPEKNSLAYHCVQHQKFAWILKAALADPSYDSFVWLDYGIGHVPGVTPSIVNSFLAKVKKDDFAIPGCWEKGGVLISDFFPCWRFCGGVLVVPRGKALGLYKAVKITAKKHLSQTHNVEWEVNTLARAEPLIRGLRWYKADHNETMFTNYEVEDVRVAS